jgi:two-component system, response regulator YesN
VLIKLLVVDDESTTRNGIIKHINWDDLGVGIVKDAKDGIDALKIAYDFKPDIVISDIRMPGLNGIELATKLREKFINCKIIFLSGYSDKEYLKAAIKLSAVNYVEKPINLIEIKEAIEKAVDLCKEDDLNMTLSENITLIKQKIVKNLIHKDAKIQECYKLLGLIKSNLVNPKRFYTVIINITNLMDDNRGDNLINSEEFTDIVDKYFEEVEHIASFKDDSTFVIILSKDKETENQIESLKKILDNYLEEHDISDVKMFFAVGKKVLGMEKIYESYTSAKRIVKKLFFYGYERVIYSEYEINSPYNIQDSIYEEFIECIGGEIEKQAIFFIERLCLDIKKYDETHVKDIKSMFFKLMLELIDEAEKRGVYFTEEEQLENKHLWDLISNFNTLEELKGYVIDKISKVFRKFNDMKDSCRSVFEVKKYIRRDYSNRELSVKSLAEAVFLTPTYLSALFKKETGQNISDYIVEVRIEKSKEYLKNNKLKLHEVAMLVGYNDANYYAKAFKKLECVTPSEYREKYSS